MEWYLPQLKTFPDSFCSIKWLHGNDETLRKRFRLKTAKHCEQTLLLARKYRKDHDCLKERQRIMGNTRNGHAWSLYTSNKTHEFASRIPELAPIHFVIVTWRRGVICDPSLLQVHFTADSKGRLCLLVFCRIECELIKLSCYKTWY